MGVISDRRRRKRGRRIGVMALLGCAVLLGVVFAAGPRLQDMRQGVKAAVQALSRGAQLDMELPQVELYALQLAVFDSGARAQAEAERLGQDGVHCVIWQRERMRLISSVARTKDALDGDSAKGHDVYVIEDTLAPVRLRLHGNRLEDVRTLLLAPDDALARLMDGEALETVVFDVRRIAESAAGAHTEHALHAQLTGNLMDWCALMEKTAAKTDDQTARSYAAVTMHLLCRELRSALMDQPSRESTASAQRTPSTAADVMPPA